MSDGKVQVTLHLKPDTASYLATCARIRGISTTGLVRRLLDVIATDLMVGAIMDDENNMRIARLPGERPFREPHNG